jgi:FkbM family methyltransferase
MEKQIFLIKILNRIPRTLLIKIGYSKLGEFIIKKLKNNKSQKKCEIENGIKIYFDLTNPLTWELILKKDFETKVKNAFIENIKKGDTVIDVGANIGEFSLLASKIVGHGGRVFAIEPLPEICQKLKNNFLLNNFNNYNILKNALGKEVDKVNIYKKSDSGNIGFIESVVDGKNLVKTNDIIEVETLDNVILKNQIKKVNMLKIDVEGFEYDVFLGGRKSLDKIENIICEIHTKYLHKKGIDESKIFSILEKNKFKIKILEKLDKKGTIHILAHKNHLSSDK